MAIGTCARAGGAQGIERGFAAERVLAGEAKPGFQTPSTAFGADFILEFDGVRRISEQ